MEMINAVILGIVEGLTEFLPVSSTGHLILVERLFGFADKAFSDTFMVLIQSGAILAVILTWWRRFLPIGGTTAEKQASWALWTRTIVGFIPFAVLALVLNKSIKAVLFFPVPVALALVFWGIGIILVEAYQKKRQGPVKYERPEDLPWGLVIAIGLFQCLALVPGTSRSAATIVGALLLGVSRVAAAEFSFFMAIPTLLAAGAYEILDSFLEGGLAFSGYQWAILGVGTLVSFVVALLVIRLFMGFIRTRSFTGFGVYRIVLGIVVLATIGLGLL